MDSQLCFKPMCACPTKHTTSTHYCSVPYCRYPNTHVIASHLCGECGMIGHGKSQCRNNSKIDPMQMLERIPIEAQCTVPNCQFPSFHTSSNHCCIFCRVTDNSHWRKCPIKTPLESFDQSTHDEPEILPPIGHYVVKLSGQGSVVFCRNNFCGKYEYFFLHGDHYGQYGDDTSDIPIVNSFVLGYIRMNTFL